MEILGLCLTVISLIGAYLWKANGNLQRTMMQALERIEEGQKEMSLGQREIAQMLFNQTKILEKIEAKIPG
ncbi:hypothetical protein KKG61_04265 [bacterium]|nr:hypothetical protein [bacterium]MBU1599303.1 hypothetical protein [bacterium]MBU2462366.1 hypothetical protein [bacterium]